MNKIHSVIVRQWLVVGTGREGGGRGRDIQ